MREPAATPRTPATTPRQKTTVPRPKTGEREARRPAASEGGPWWAGVRSSREDSAAGGGGADAEATAPIDRPARTQIPEHPRPEVPKSTTAGAERARRKAAAAGVDTSTPARTGASARRELRRATKERRRYERAEARRFTQRSRRRRLAWAVVGASVAGLVLLVLLVAYSPLLAVRSIVVEGTSRLDAAAVTTALADEQGKPLALVDYGSIERDLAQFPLIASYSVEARPPNTLAVRIVERRPVAQVQTDAGFDLIDAAGVTVQQSATRLDGFPVLDLSGTTIGSPGFTAAAAVLTSLPDTLLSQVSLISGSTPDSVTMTFTGAGQRVLWGDADDSDLKALILERLIAAQDPAAQVEYDVSSPQSPVIR